MPAAIDYVGLSIEPRHEPLSGRKNDLHVDAAGNLVMVTGAHAIAQHARQRLKFWKGEWFLDVDAGIDHLAYVLGRKPTEIDIAEATLKLEIMRTPGVVEIVEWEAEFDRRTRGLHVRRARVLTVFDEIVDINVN